MNLVVLSDLVLGEHQVVFLEKVELPAVAVGDRDLLPVAVEARHLGPPK